MNREKAIKVLTAELECVSRDCNRDCGKCDLVMKKDWLLSGLADAIAMLKEQKQKVRPTHKCVDGYSYITDPYMVYCPYCGKSIIGRKNKR